MMIQASDAQAAFEERQAFVKGQESWFVLRILQGAPFRVADIINGGNQDGKPSGEVRRLKHYFGEDNLCVDCGADYMAVATPWGCPGAKRAQPILNKCDQVAGFPWPHIRLEPVDYDARLLANRKRRKESNEGPRFADLAGLGHAWNVIKDCCETCGLLASEIHGAKSSADIPKCDGGIERNKRVAMGHACSISPTDKPLMQRARLGVR